MQKFNLKCLFSHDWAIVDGLSSRFISNQNRYCLRCGKRDFRRTLRKQRDEDRKRRTELALKLIREEDEIIRYNG